MPRYQGGLTGESHTHYLCGHSLPAVEVPPDATHGDLIEVNGEWFYLADDGSDEWTLSRKATGVDYGGNVHRERLAPRDLTGIAAPIGALPIRLLFADDVYFAVKVHGGVSRET